MADNVVALDYQVKGASFVYNGKRMRELETQDQVVTWIGSLKPGAIVVTELGGATDGPILFIASRGIQVYYVPTVLENQAREGYGFKGKKKDAEVLHRMFNDPKWRSSFREHQSASEAILRLAELYHVYISLIAARVALQNSITATYTRAAWIGRRAGEKVADYVKRMCADNPAFAATLMEEEWYAGEINTAVEEMELYQITLKPIVGVGSRIGAGLIALVQFASRFIDPTCPDSLKIAKKRFAEYAGLDGKAIDANLMARRRVGGEGDVGKPELKAVAYFAADQAVRQTTSPLHRTYLQRKLKELHTILDELLNSPNRAHLTFNADKENGEGLGPKMAAHRRAMRMVKEVFLVEYFFPTMLAWEKEELPDNFDANEKLAELCAIQIAKDKALIDKHAILRLARLPYKVSEKGGPTSYGEWITVCDLDVPNRDDLGSLARQKMINDLVLEIQDIETKLSGENLRAENETDDHLRKAQARREAMIQALLADKLWALKTYGRRLIWETRGIGQPICDFIGQQVSALKVDLGNLAIKQEQAEAPLRKQVDDLKNQVKDKERLASALKGKKEKIAEESVQAVALPSEIASLRQQLQITQEDLKKTQKRFDADRVKLLSGFQPDLSAVLDSDPRLVNRSGQDASLIRQAIWAIIQLRAEKGM